MRKTRKERRCARAAGFAVAWRAGLGSGYSSVAVAGGRAVTPSSSGTNDVAVAFDSKSGRELWRRVIRRRSLDEG